MENEFNRNPFGDDFIDLDNMEVGTSTFEDADIETDFDQVSPQGFEDILDNLIRKENENRERANDTVKLADINTEVDKPSFLFSRQLLAKVMLLATPIINGGYRLNTGRGITIIPEGDGIVTFVAYNDTNLFRYTAPLDRKENTIQEPITISLNLLNKISSMLGNQVLLFKDTNEKEGKTFDVLKTRLVGGDFILEDWQVGQDSLEKLNLVGDSEEVMKTIPVTELADTVKVFQPLFSEAINTEHKSINFDEDSKVGTFIVNNIYMTSEIDMPSFVLRPTELGLLSKVALINDLKDSDLTFYKVIDSKNSATRINVRFGNAVLQAIVSLKQVDAKIVDFVNKCKEYKSDAQEIDFNSLLKVVGLASNSTITSGDIEFASIENDGLTATIFSRSGESKFKLNYSVPLDKVNGAKLSTKARPLLKMLSAFRNTNSEHLSVYLSDDNMIIFNNQFTALFFPRSVR